MRRSDREVTNIEDIEEIIKKCDVCRLALANDNIPYIIPMNFGYTLSEGKLALYFHCANVGKKLDMIRINSNACFEMDCSHKLITGETACDYSMEYESIIGNGIISIIKDNDHKSMALNTIMKKYSAIENAIYEDKMLNAVTVFVLEAADFSAKRLSRQ